MGWLVAALSDTKEEQLVQSHGREGAEQQDRVFVFAFLYINSPPFFCHRCSVCAGTGRPWDCAWGQLPLWPEQAALAPMPELWGSSHAARCDSLLPGCPVQPGLAAHSPNTGFLYQTWALCAICSPWHLSHGQGRWQLFPLLWATVLHHHLQQWIPPEMCGNVSPCHECLTSSLRARDISECASCDWSRVHGDKSFQVCSRG